MRVDGRGYPWPCRVPEGAAKAKRRAYETGWRSSASTRKKCVLDRVQKNGVPDPGFGVGKPSRLHNQHCCGGLWPAAPGGVSLAPATLGVEGCDFNRLSAVDAGRRPALRAASAARGG